MANLIQNGGYTGRHSKLVPLTYSAACHCLRKPALQQTSLLQRCTEGQRVTVKLGIHTAGFKNYINSFLVELVRPE